MKKLAIILSAVILSGCTLFVPVKPPKFPDLPESLKQKCEKLKTIEGEKVSITDMLKVVVQNYGLYHECSIKVDGWNDWYIEQKKILDKVSK